MPGIDDEIKVGAKDAPKEKPAAAIRNLKKDRTLIVTSLTSEAPIEPEVVSGLKTMDDVFKHFKPEASVEFEDKDGQQHEETIHFENLADFTPKGISKQSEFLLSLQLEQDFMGDLIKQLKSNKTLQKVLEDPETKEEFLKVLDALINKIPEE